MIKHINYKGTKYPIRVAYRALNGFKKDTGIDFEKMGKGEEKDLEYYEPLLFYSLVSGCKGEEIKMPFTREQMPDVLDECMFEFVALLPLFFPEELKKTRAQKRKDERRK